MDEAAIFKHYGPTQRRMLEYLLHEPQGLSVERLTADLAVTPSAVRQHLARLERDGLVERARQQPTRGRPEQLYALTLRGREIFPRRYRHLAEGLIAEIGETIGQRKLEGVMRRMGKRAGDDLATDEGGRASLASTAAAMRGLGYEAEMNADDPSEIVAYNCVFHRLAERFPAVCQFDLAFLESATGDRVEHRECMVRGGKACRFGFKREK